MHRLNLWSAATYGCGRLPFPEELESQLFRAGYSTVDIKSLMPGDSYDMFVATTPGL